jgi:hypothetical protein
VSHQTIPTCYCHQCTQGRLGPAQRMAQAQEDLHLYDDRRIQHLHAQLNVYIEAISKLKGVLQHRDQQLVAKAQECIDLSRLLREARPVIIDMQKYIGRGFMGDVQELGKRLEHVRATIDAALGAKE